MRKTITINEKEYEMKANLGTAILYKNLTGRDWLSDLNRIKKKEIPEMMETYGIILQMFFCMNVHGKTVKKEDESSETYLERLEKQISDKKYFIWLDENDFDFSSFDIKIMTEVLGLWNKQKISTIESKN